MEQIFTSVLAAQAVFLLLAVIPLIICWYMEKLAALISMTVVVVVIWHGLDSLPSGLQSLYEYGWFRSLLDSVFQFDARLVSTWKELGAWVAFAGGAIAAWAMTIAFVIMMPASNVIRGTELLPAEKMLQRLKQYGKGKSPALVGQFYIPTLLETRSLALFGEPGSGKTQMILRLLASLRRRSDRVIAMDVGGDLYQKLASKGDRLLSVLAEGGEEWSPFAEIKSLNDCNTIANAFIPLGMGESRAWHGYARELLTVFLRECWKTNQRTNQQLLHYVRIATNEELKALVRGSSVQRLFEPGSEKMLSNVQSILSQSLSPLDLLEPSAGEQSFSLREWVRAEADEGWLWISYDDLTAAATAPLRAAWTEILARAVLSLYPNTERRIWFSLDELASNGKIDVLSQALARGRKYGLSLILGIQNIAQLYSIYGRDEAASILGSVGHMVVLRTPDADTSDYLSRTIGDVETSRDQVSVSSQGGSSTQKIRETKRSVLASEISKLRDLDGYIKIAGVGWSRLKVPVVKLKDRLSIKAKAEPSPYIFDHDGRSRTERWDNSATQSSLDDI